MSNDPNPAPEPTPEGGDPKPGEQTYTQADVDKIIGRTRIEERRKVSEKYADYDDLKTKAAGATTLEERVAQIETQAKESEARALRAEVANAKSLTPNQAKRLNGETREELEKDADDLLKDIGVQKKNGNHSPREGETPKPGTDGGEREFVNELWGRATSD